MLDKGRHTREMFKLKDASNRSTPFPDILWKVIIITVIYDIKADFFSNNKNYIYKGKEMNHPVTAKKNTPKTHLDDLLLN